MPNIKYIVLLSVLVIVGLVYFTSPQRNKTSNENVTTVQTEESKESVPLPSQEDIIRTFFSLINEKRISEAISMLSENLAGNESAKQTWGVHFNAINSVTVVNVDSSSDFPAFKVILDVQMNPESANAPIPYYGWENGSNIRWLTLEKVGNIWKISDIATGP